MTEKPPYAVPTMREIRRRRSNGLTVVSTFTGAGGSCLGFRMAGFRTVWASEFVEAARETYAANFPRVPIDPRDVREISGDDVRAATGLEEFDVLEGSPPCASFSQSGIRDEGWGQVRKYSDTRQRTDDLFDEYIRLVREIRPRAIVAENVKGLVSGKAKGYFIRIMAGLRDAGYVVEARLLDAQWLGVPQRRQRVIIIGYRDDLGITPTFPSPLPYRYTLGDALGSVGLVHVHGYGKEKGTTHHAADPAPTVMADGIAGNARGNVVVEERAVVGTEKYNAPVNQNDPRYLERTDVDEPVPMIRADSGKIWIREGVPYDERDPSEDGGIERYAIGKEARTLRPMVVSEKYDNLIVASEDHPSPAITAAGGGAGTASVVHPNARRKFTIDELRAVCGFPPDFVLTGTYARQWERLGRAVPPPMMEAVARKIREALR